MVTPEPMNLDWGPDARARIAVDPKGGLIVTFAIFQDKNFNGRAFFARSSDDGATFTRPQPITADTTSQRFETAGVDPAGRVFAAWLDKRNIAKARAAGRAYPGAALAYAWEDGDAGFGKTGIALDNTCECCRLGLAFAGAGRPAVVFRNIFPGSVRDHAVVTFKDATTPGPCAASASTTGRSRPARITAPASPSRPTAPSTSPGSPTARRARACSMPAPTRPTQPFGPPRALSPPDRQPARPYLLADGSALHLVWKEFDGTKAVVRWQVCARQRPAPGAKHAPSPRPTDASDHPLLVADARRAYLSWLTKVEGYRLIPLGDQP